MNSFQNSNLKLPCRAAEACGSRGLTAGAASFSGLILIDKPVHFTSTHIVRYIKKTLNIAQVGHLGTLDPFATGLLPIMIGGVTRLAEDLMDLDKQYLFTIKLGIKTDTFDSTGQVIQTESVPKTIDKKTILEILKNYFYGEIKQTPPVYSALKMDGRPLYEYMRSTGKLPYDIKTKIRSVYIYNLKLLDFSPDDKTITLRAVCSKGTYIRSLANDIALALGTIGMCLTLRREKIGSFSVDNAMQLPLQTNVDFEQNLLKFIISPYKILPQFIVIEFLDKYLLKLQAGNIFCIRKEEDFANFEKLEIYLNKFGNIKFFAKIINCVSPLFLSVGEILNSHTIKIMPKKKI